MKVHFNLRDAKAKEKTSIVLTIRHYQKPLKWSTGLHISPTLWDAKRNRPKAGNLPHVREQLNALEVLTEQKMSSAGYLTQSDFSALMNEATGKAEPEKTPFLFAFIREYCAENTRKELKLTGRILYNFITGANVAIWPLIDWDKARAKDVKIEAITWDFRKRLIRYCFDQNYSVSYVQGTLKRFGQFINESRANGHHQNAISKERGWANVQGAGVEKAKNVPIALSLEELNRLAALELTGIDERIRDCFLIGAFTGQRWSDYGFIKPYQVKGDLVRFYQQEKTENYCEVELDLFAGLVPHSLGDLLAKYGNQSPIITEGKQINKTADVKINERVKFFCRRAGITEKMRWSEDSGGKIKEYEIEKWEAMGTHTARRTFATIWYNLGMPVDEICSVTGHKNATQLMEYIGVTQDEKRKKRRETVAAIKAHLKAI